MVWKADELEDVNKVPRARLSESLNESYSASLPVSFSFFVTNLPETEIQRLWLVSRTPGKSLKGAVTPRPKETVQPQNR
jgi:hypothetical protein